MANFDRRVESKLTRSSRNQPMVEGAVLIWRNFSGAEKQFNEKGNRNVTLVLSEEMYNELGDEGYNVKAKPIRDNPNEMFYYLELKVKYSEGTRDPKLLLITSGGRTLLDGDTVGTLDFSRILQADIIINPFNYDINGRKGVAAYLEQGYFTIEENDFDRKYAGVGDVGGPRTDTFEEESPY